MKLENLLMAGSEAGSDWIGVVGRHRAEIEEVRSSKFGGLVNWGPQYQTIGGTP